MGHLVECIPNFSEGRDANIIGQIADAIKSKAVRLLSVDSERAYNRTVATFAGSPEAVEEAAFVAVKTAVGLIDMARHKGQHPRLGAADVCPFVPVSAGMETCVQCARHLGARVGNELAIPVFLYGYAATQDYRRELAAIRKGEYEGLPAKIIMPEWKPDFGPAEFNAKSGACIIGARSPQLAYNVNLNTSNMQIGREIAGRIRESGRIVDGKRVPGILKKVRAMGVLLADHNLVQVSMNLDDLNTTSLLRAFQTVRKLAESLGYKATGSEVCGLVSKEMLLEAGRYRAGEEHKADSDECKLLDLAIEYLGLNQLYPFETRKRVLEYALATDDTA